MVSVVSLDQFKDGEGSLSVRAIAGEKENRAWWTQQGIYEIRAAAKHRKASADTKNLFLAVQAAMWDGYRLEYFKLEGGYGWVRILVRDGKVLTRKGFESYLVSRYQVES